MKVTIYTDGCCLGNPGPGGCAAIVRQHNGKIEEMSRGYRTTTNNRMELRAVILALESTFLHEPKEILLVTDSMVVVHGIQAAAKKAKKHERANPDLWAQYHRLIAKHTIFPMWVKGHAGHPENERCDKLAAIAARGRSLIPDHGYESLGELFG